LLYSVAFFSIYLFSASKFPDLANELIWLACGCGGVALLGMASNEPGFFDIWEGGWGYWHGRQGKGGLLEVAWEMN